MIRQPETRDIIDELTVQAEKQELRGISTATIIYLCSRIRVLEAEVQRQEKMKNRLLAQLQTIESAGQNVLGHLHRRGPDSDETNLLKRVLGRPPENSTGTSTGSGSSTTRETAEYVESL